MESDWALLDGEPIRRADVDALPEADRVRVLVRTEEGVLVRAWRFAVDPERALREVTESAQ